MKIQILILLILTSFIPFQTIYGQEISNYDSLSDDESLEITIRDQSFYVEEFVSGLEWPTMMAFSGNDILVLEKNSGNIRLIKNGQLQEEPLLKLDVSVSLEEGLLGILIKNSTVYLHSTNRNAEDNTVSNLFYKYNWDGKELTEPKLLKEIHGGGGIHNGGVMVSHPNDNVYGILGDIENRKGILQNYEEGEPDDTSSIFSLETEEPYFAIGIRNSFGLAIDPITGFLWDTENGPDVFDEINLVPFKFNSGWASIQGPATQTEIANLPSFGDYTYSDPEFSWEDPIGITSILFIQSDLFKEYHDSVLVGDFNNGALHELKLNKNRTGFVFDDPSLRDLVLNRNDLTNELIFATGFAGITDIKEGPDGFIYIVSIGDGKIYRIIPSEKTSSTDVINCLQALQEIKPRVNLSKCDLSGLDLQNADLSFSNLSFSNLENANLSNTNLHGATLSSANLVNINLNGADMSDTEMISVILKGVNLENLNLKNANLKSANLENAILTSTDLSNAILENANIKNANLSRADLSNANLKSANLENAILTSADLSNTNMVLTDLTRADLANADLRYSKVWKSNFYNTQMIGSNFVGTDIYASKFIKSNIQNSDFRNSKISSSTFLDSDLSGTDIMYVYPIETSFENVIVSKESKINTCLEHDLSSRILNKILREIRGDNFNFLMIFENSIIQLCKL
ncbi:Secreted effector protein pipB2 [Marine Group I thaumarchaeote SCGC AAA799-D07]|nr:Secreted effector protein pipB2 [Marine Group I thaumarchaeote SCGC AAA799-D07]